MNSLTIRISTERIIFCVYDRLANMVPEYEVYENDASVSLNANLHKAIRKCRLARDMYDLVDTYFVEPMTLIPLREFEEEDIDEVYFYNSPNLKESCKVFYDSLPYLNAILLFSVDKGVCHSLQEFYPNVKFHCALTSLVLQYGGRYPFSAVHPRLYCYLDEGMLTLVAFKRGELAFLNAYRLHNDGDALYYIACVAERLGMKPEDEMIYVGGSTLEAKNVVLSMDRIGYRGFLMEDTEELSHHPIGRIGAFPYDLKVILLKAY